MNPDVMVIGTEPPCPRCDLLGRLVEEAAGGDMHVILHHCAFDSDEARSFGLESGFKTGTAKHIAEEAGITMDWDAVYGIIEREKKKAGPDSHPADAWTPELDFALAPCQAAAESVGYLMTPILVVNGLVKHHGSVPKKEQIAHWLSE